MTFLLVGLGNPGKQYEKTRHNVGFMVVDEVANALNASFTDKFNAHFAKTKYQGRDVILLKPQTYMNLSGSSVVQAKNFYRVEPQSVYVFYDDVDLELARIKVKLGGSSGGHNGIKSIDSIMGANYNRIRFGVGRPQFNTADYVLSPFKSDELIEVHKQSECICRHLDLLFDKHFDKLMNKCAINVPKVKDEVNNGS